MYQNIQDKKLDTLNYAEKYWTWKAGLRVVICILNIIAIGTAGWLVTTGNFLDEWSSYYLYDLFPDWTIGVFTTSCTSLTWCFLAILIPFLLKKTRPLHPGIAVGLDLVFWLGFLTTGTFALFGVLAISSWGWTGYMSDISYYYGRNYTGVYSQQPNGTWVYDVTYMAGGVYNYSTQQYTYPPGVNLSSVVRVCSPRFTSCQEQDQFVNDLWQEKSTGLAASILVNSIEWLNVLLHFALFVWACVDTHRLKKRTRTTTRQVLADEIISDLEKRGIILTKVRSEMPS